MGDTILLKTTKERQRRSGKQSIWGWCQLGAENLEFSAAKQIPGSELLVHHRLPWESVFKRDGLRLEFASLEPCFRRTPRLTELSESRILGD
jgi:hypothetical protein